MKFIRKIYLSNLAFLILPLLIITVTIYVVGLDVFQTQMHDRNQLYLDNIERMVSGHMNLEKIQPGLTNLTVPDGIVLMVDHRNNVVAGSGDDFNPTMHQEFVNKVDWQKKSQGNSYIIESKKYYLYHRPIINSEYSLLYFRSKRISDAILMRFSQTLIVSFIGLLFLFFYFQKNLMKRMVSPLEELVQMVQSLTGRKPFFTLRSAEEDEIDMIKTYLTQLQESVRDRDLKLRRNLFSVMDVLIDLLEIKDSYTASHSKQVRKYSIAISQMLGLPEQEVRDIAFAATLHDIGKIGVSRTILNKPGKLTLQEFAVIKQHPVVADEVLKNIEELEYIRKIIRHHHEKFDGTGYPDKLQGEGIPLAARVVSVADSFDAMTSDRPYRKALSNNEAIAILLEERGRQFDPRVVDALVTYLYRQNLYDTETAASNE